MRKPPKGANVDRGRHSVVHHPDAIAIGGTGACDLHHRPEPLRSTRSSASAAVPVTVASADLPYLTGLGSLRAFFTVGIRSQVDGKFIVTSRLSEAGRVVVNRLYALRLDRRVMTNEPPASTLAKQSPSS
jgi:hypothetical protein